MTLNQINQYSVTPASSKSFKKNGFKLFLAIFVAVVIFLGVKYSLGITNKTKNSERTQEKAAELSDKKSDEPVKDINENAIGKIPDNFPKDMSIYTNGEIISATLSYETKLQGKSYSVSLNSPDKLQLILDYYNLEIGKNGWNVVGNFNLDKTKTVTAVKDMRSMVVSLSENDNGTSISISVVEPKIR